MNYVPFSIIMHNVYNCFENLGMVFNTTKIRKNLPFSEEQFAGIKFKLVENNVERIEITFFII